MARLEAVQNFLAYATYKDFRVLQMDSKSAFLNGKLQEVVYVKQPLGFNEKDHLEYIFVVSLVPNKVLIPISLVSTSLK